MKYNSEAGSVLILTLMLLAVSIILISGVNEIIYNDTNRFERDTNYEKAKQSARAGLEVRLNELKAGGIDDKIDLGTTSSALEIDGYEYETEVEFSSLGAIVIQSRSEVEGQKADLAAVEEVPKKIIDYNNFVVSNGWLDANTSEKIAKFNRNEDWSYFYGASNNSIWKVKNESVEFDPPNSNSAVYNPQDIYGVFYNLNSAKDYELEIDIKNSGTKDTEITSGLIGLTFRYQDNDNYYFAAFEGPDGGSYKLILKKKVDGTLSTLDNTGFTFDLSNDPKLRVEVGGSNIKVYVDDNKKLENDDSTLSDGSYGPIVKGMLGAKLANLKAFLGGNIEDDVIEDETAVNDKVLPLDKETEKYEGPQYEYDSQRIYYMEARFKQQDEPSGSNDQTCIIGIKNLDDTTYLIDEQKLKFSDSIAVDDRWKILEGYFTEPITDTEIEKAVEKLRPVYISSSEMNEFKPYFTIENNDGGEVRVDYVKVEELEVNKN